MAITYPTTLDALNNPAAADKEDNSAVYHDVQHSDANDAVEALEAKVGVNASTVTTSLDYKVRSLNGNEYPQATGAEDDDFNDESFSGWTKVEDTTPLITVTEARGSLSVLHPSGDASQELHGIVKAHTFATNDYCETAFVGLGLNASFHMGGLCISDGTTWGTSDGVYWLYSHSQVQFRVGNFTNFNTDGTVTAYTAPPAGSSTFFYRLRYEGSNTFRGYVSCDGTSWIDITGAKTFTLTPTHWGLMTTGWGAATPFTWNFKYFKTGNG